MMNIGFIGTGAISEAVITGLLSSGNGDLNIVISPRNAQRARLLAQKYERVSVAGSNQSVIDSSDVVCLAIRPQIAEEVLGDLVFRDTQTVISFVATYSRADLERFVTPVTKIFRMVPIPAVAKNMGPVVIAPPSEQIKTLFSELGNIIEVEGEDQFQALWAATAMMAPYFALLNTVSHWLKEQGIPAQQADTYIGALFHSTADAGLSARGEGFGAMVEEYATPGGLNEQLMRELTEVGCYDSISKGLTLIYDRLNGLADFNDRIK